jgi:hypothetical protein
VYQLSDTEELEFLHQLSNTEEFLYQLSDTVDIEFLHQPSYTEEFL